MTCAEHAASGSPAALAVRRLVWSAPTTTMTPEAPFARTDASATASTGGESRITQSKCSPRVARYSAHRFDPSSSAGLGGIIPAGNTQRFFTTVFRTASLGLQAEERKRQRAD